MTDQPTTPAAPRAKKRPAAGPAAARHVESSEHLSIAVPLVGTIHLPRPEQLAYYGAIGVLLALEIIDWPVAVLVAAGHVLASQQHNRAIQEFGAGLEEAEH